MRNHSTLRRTAAGAAIALTAGLAGAMLVAAPAHAITITVTTDADAFPVAPVGSLREAIEAANLSAGFDQIEFAANVDVITLVADLPNISQDLRILGNAGDDNEIEIVSPDDTFVVNAGVSFALENADIDGASGVSGNGVQSADAVAIYLVNVRTLGYPQHGVLVDNADLSITLSNISNNGGAGVFFTSSGNDDTFYTTSSDFNNNVYGLNLALAGGADSVIIQDVEATLNALSGIRLDAVDVEGTMDLSRLNLHENSFGLDATLANSDLGLASVVANDNDQVGLYLRGVDSTIEGSAIEADRNGLVTPWGIGGGLSLELDDSSLEIEGLQANGNLAEYGGGIGVNLVLGVSTFSLTDADVFENTASEGSGGGIYFDQVNSSGNTAKQLTFDDVRVRDNTAQIGGGGLYVDDFGAGVPFAGGIDITESTFAGNTALDGDGGGIHVGAFTHSTDGFPIIEIDNSTISGNSAPEAFGGGLFLDKGQDTLEEAAIAIVNSTISGNTAFFGGAAWIGGNAANDDQVRISSDSNTIVNNTASNVGGFLFEDSTTEFAVYNTILANNSGLVDLFYQDTPDPGVLTVNYSNVGAVLPDLAPFIAAGTGNQVGVDPLLGDLADNGGPTLTHLPQPGSPVFDAGDPAFTPPPAFDQRGEARVITRIDMGSVESPKTFKLADTGAEFSPALPLGALVLLLGGAALVLWRVRARA